MSETRKIAAVLVVDVVGYSRLAGADEDRTLARLRGLRSDLIDPAVAANRGRIVKRTGDGALVEFRSLVDAVRCAVEVQNGMIERNAGVPAERRIEFRIGIHLGDVVEEADGDLMGDGVNIAARLEGVAAPGSICLSEDAYRQVKGRIDLSATDLGLINLKNIVEPMRVYSIDVAAPEKPKAAPGEAAAPRLALPGKPSIAVLPFQNMSGDPEQEYFADGIVEDIITGLSRIRWLFVIARNSSFTFKGKSVDVRLVGRELGVRYVVEGGVRKAGNRLRVTAQLVEAETGAHLWADRYDGVLEDVFDLQDKITEQVVGIVEPSVQRSEIERSRRKRPESLDAYDLYLRALPHVAAHMPSDAKAAIPLLEEALRLDSDYAAARAHLAWSYELCFTRAGFAEMDRAAALRHARAVLAGNTDDAAALAISGFVLNLLSDEQQAGLAAIGRALSLHPSCATALFLAAQAHALAAHSATATSFADRALRLSPLDPFAMEGHLALGLAAMHEGHCEDAVSCFARAAQANRNFSLPYFFQSMALALLGRIEEAKSLVARGLELEPGFRTAVFSFPYWDRALAGKFVEGARLLGLPE